MNDLERTIKLQVERHPTSYIKLPILVVLRGESLGLTIRLEGERTIIGRGNQADVVLNDDIASRQHAEITRSVALDGSYEYHLADLSSTNGTFLNGARSLSDQILKDGDKIKIGNHLLQFSLVDLSEAEAISASQGPTRSDPPRADSVKHTFYFLPFHLTADVDLLYRGETVVPLEPRAVCVLRYLVGNHDRVVSKEELLEAVWPDVFTTDGVLKKAISQARHALGDDAKTARYIETYHRRGYRFIATVERRVQYHT